jgi:hypothetical protein
MPVGVTYAAGPKVDSVLLLAVLEPTSTLLLEYCRSVELVKVSVDIV